MVNRVVLVEDDVPGAKLVKKPEECSVEMLTASPGLMCLIIPHSKNIFTSSALPFYRSEMKQAPPDGKTAIRHFIAQ